MSVNIDKSILTRHYDPDGDLVSEDEHEPNSFVQGFANLLATQGFNDDSAPLVTALDGTDEDLTADADSFRYVGLTNTDARGLHFGSDATAVAYDDSDLGSRFTSNISYDSGTISFSQSATESTLTYERTINNDGSSNITAREVGVAVNASDTASNIVFILITRDILDSAVTLEPNDSLAGEVSLKFSV